MNRYTSKTGSKRYTLELEDIVQVGGGLTKAVLTGDAITRLGLYEDLEMTPEEIAAALMLTEVKEDVVLLLSLIDEVVRMQREINDCTSAQEREEIIKPYLLAISRYKKDQELIAQLRKEKTNVIR